MYFFSVCVKRLNIFMSTMPMELLFLKLKSISSLERFRYSELTSSMTADKGTFKIMNLL